MSPPSSPARPRLSLGFEIEPDSARRLRGLALLRGMTEGRAQTRPAASGEGFRSHRLLRPDPSTSIEMLLALEPSAPGGDPRELAGRVRLTLLDGSADAFVALVLRLHAAVFLRLEAAETEATSLDPDGATESALATILRARLGDLLRLHGAAASTGEVEAVHQTRVGLRRLRAALGLFKPLLPSAFSSHFNEEARWLGSMLAPVRDWDVFLSESLTPFLTRLPTDPGLSELARLAAEARDRAAEAMSDALRSSRCLAFHVELELAIQRRVWREQAVTETAASLFAPIGEIAPDLIDRLWRGVRRDGKRLSTGGPEASHDLRKKIKKLRYSIEFFGELYSKRDVKGYLADLAQMQQRLGVANDATVAQALTAQLVRGHPTAALVRIEGFIAGWLAHQWGDAPPDAEEGWRRLRSAPKFWRERADG
jgi:triphosphatase